MTVKFTLMAKRPASSAISLVAHKCVLAYEYLKLIRVCGEQQYSEVSPRRNSDCLERVEELSRHNDIHLILSLAASTMMSNELYYMCSMSHSTAAELRGKQKKSFLPSEIVFEI